MFKAHKSGKPLRRFSIRKPSSVTRIPKFRYKSANNSKSRYNIVMESVFVMYLLGLFIVEKPYGWPKKSRPICNKPHDLSVQNEGGREKVLCNTSSHAGYQLVQKLWSLVQPDSIFAQSLIKRLITSTHACTCYSQKIRGKDLICISLNMIS